MAEPLRDRARRATGWRFRPNGDERPHYVVCGSDPLAYWVVRALLATDPAAGQVRVTLVVPERRRSDGPDGRDVPGVRVVLADRLDEATFRRAGLADAAGLALLHQDDVGNMHATLCAQEVEPGLRLVVRMYNTNLADGLRQLLPDSAIISDASMAAPAFVAAALGEVAPTHFRHAGRTLYVARRTDVRRARTWSAAWPSPPIRSWSGCCPPTRPRPTWCWPRRPASRPAPSWPPAGWCGRGGTGGPVEVLLRAVRSFATRKIGIAVLVLLGVIAVLGWLNTAAAGVDCGGQGAVSHPGHHAQRPGPGREQAGGPPR